MESKRNLKACIRERHFRPGRRLDRLRSGGRGDLLTITATVSKRTILITSSDRSVEPKGECGIGEPQVFPFFFFFLSLILNPTSLRFSAVDTLDPILGSAADVCPLDEVEFSCYLPLLQTYRWCSMVVGSRNLRNLRFVPASCNLWSVARGCP